MTKLRAHFLGDITDYHKSEKGVNVRDLKRVWNKTCVKCKEAFKVYSLSESGVRKCLRCKYD